MNNSPDNKTLSTRQALRYSRQIMLPGFDLDKQERLLNSRVLVIGVGGLGCAAAQYLVAAGVGHLTLVDDDVVALSNLQRQVLHAEASLGKLKTESAKTQLLSLNPECNITTINQRADQTLLTELIPRHDVVVDCCDNLTTRQQINAICFASKTPLVSGAAIRMEGQISSFTFAADEPCYQCFSRMMGEANLSCMEAGVMSPVVGIIGAMQALESIKLLTDFGKSLSGQLLMLDAMTCEWRSFNLVKNPKCKVCAQV